MTYEKSLQYQQDDGTYIPFDASIHSDLERTFVLMDFDKGSYQIRIPGKWDANDVQNTIDSEIARYIAIPQAIEEKVTDLQAVVDGTYIMKVDEAQIKDIAAVDIALENVKAVDNA